MTSLTVSVMGVPVPQGSIKSIGRGRLTHSNNATLRPWRDTVAWHVREQMANYMIPEPLEGPLEFAAHFVLPRPQSAPKRRWAPDRKPDLDKLLRALMDACTIGGAWVDDAQVVTVTAGKRYPGAGERPGVTFTVTEARADSAV